MSAIVNQFIVGYVLLPEAVQTEFEVSKPGQEFTEIIQNYSSFLQNLNSTSSRIMGWFRSNPGKKEQLIQDELKKQKKELMLRIGEAEEYQKIVAQSMGCLLKKEIDEFQLLTEAQQKLLSRTEFSKKLLNTLASLDPQLEEDRQAIQQSNVVSRFLGNTAPFEKHIIQLQIERNEAISLWKNEFSEHTGFRKTIAEKKEI